MNKYFLIIMAGLVLNFSDPAYSTTRVFFKSSLGGTHASFYLSCANDDCSEIDIKQGFADMYFQVHTQTLVHSLPTRKVYEAFTQIDSVLKPPFQTPFVFINWLNKFFPHPIKTQLQNFKEACRWMKSHHGETKVYRVSEKAFYRYMNQVIPALNNGELDAKIAIGARIKD